MRWKREVSRRESRQQSVVGPGLCPAAAEVVPLEPQRADFPSFCSSQFFLKKRMGSDPLQHWQLLHTVAATNEFQKPEKKPCKQFGKLRKQHLLPALPTAAPGNFTGPIPALWFWWAFPSHSSSQPWSFTLLPAWAPTPLCVILDFCVCCVNIIIWIPCTNWSDYIEVIQIAEMPWIKGAWLDNLSVVSEMCIHSSINELHCSLLIDLLSVLRFVCVGFWWHITAVSSAEPLPSPTFPSVVLVFWSSQQVLVWWNSFSAKSCRQEMLLQRETLYGMGKCCHIT